MSEHVTNQMKSLPFVDRFVRRNPFFYRRARRNLDSWASMCSPEELEAVLLKRLERTLRVAGQTEYGAAFAGRRLDDWPLLDKESAREKPATLWSKAGFHSVGSTSGTTGTPLQVRRSLRAIAFERAVIDRALASQGVDDSSARHVILRGDNIKNPDDFDPPFWKVGDGGRALIMSSNHICAGTVAEYIAAIEAHQPAYMIAYPTSLEALCVHCRAEGLSTSVPVILTQAERLTAQCRSLATDVLSAVVIEEYGQAERVAKAYSHEPGSARFVPGYSFVELLATEEEAVWEIVGTSFENRAMPLVRYRTGDRIQLARTPGREYMRLVRLGLEDFKGVMGRSGDYLVSPEGVRLTGVDHIPRGVHNVLQSQVIQEGRDVRIVVVTTPKFSKADEAAIIQNARKKIPNNMTVSVEPAERLWRTAAGKAPFVVRRGHTS